jgi:arabinose-5-phosphate isomerase
MSHATAKPAHAADADPDPTAAPDGAASDAQVVEAVRQVVELEGQGLSALAASLEGPLGAAMTAATRLIARAPGHVVVTGMGKSGHVGRKVAATMASTGTPAFFVHPGEASHGDLGMITRDNVVMALSNSGETAELSDLLIYTRRFRIPLIAITSVADSSLAREADVALVLPPVEEACPLGLAPTSSTTLALVVGDALAVALLRLKGFSRENFREFHPGGKLGNVLRRVRDIMHTGAALPLVAAGLPMSKVLIEMSARGFGCVGVTDARGGLIGIVTDGDLRRHLSPEILDEPVDRVMTPAPRTIAPDALAAEALKTMQETRINALFVCADDDDRPLGFLHLHDCLRSGVY